jgi:hypothetical protein
MEDEQITYLLTVRAEPGVDAMRSLRALLKAMLRTYGLRCVKIQESKQQGRMTMDMRKYSAGVIRPEGSVRWATGGKDHQDFGKRNREIHLCRTRIRKRRSALSLE